MVRREYALCCNRFWARFADRIRLSANCEAVEKRHFDEYRGNDSRGASEFSVVGCTATWFGRKAVSSGDRSADVLDIEIFSDRCEQPRASRDSGDGDRGRGD